MFWKHRSRTSRHSGRWIGATLLVALLAVDASALEPGDEAIGFELTPPRLSFTDGEISFWRPGAEEWTSAQINVALAAGDELYTGEAANLEIQIGARAFMRAGEATQLGLTSLEPDYLQMRVTAGHVSLDLRSRSSGQTFEIDTPNAAFSIEHTGYYRVEVDGETTTFISRRGGRAVVTPAAGASGAIAASEQVVVSGLEAPQVETYAAPELDAWDRWNYERTDRQIDAVSARYVTPSVYGLSELDAYGDWRLIPTYGAVWVPRGVAVDWAPYSTGRWMYDPYYGWTWVDAAPWGWAPFHYGRWVHVSSFWAWCPGPVVVRPYYAPALVAFYGGGGFSIGISIGGPTTLGWVALSWGEPLIPWWGPVGVRGVPRWAGWGGPRIVNNVVIERKTVIHAREINVYGNARVRDAVVAVHRDQFGRRSVGEARLARRKTEKLEPVRGDLEVKPARESLSAASRPGKKPPRELLERSVVATREPRVKSVAGLEPRRAAPQAKRDGVREDAARAAPPTRVVQPPREGRRISVSQRPPFGTQSESERRAPPPAPRYRDVQQEEARRTAREEKETGGATPPAPEARRSQATGERERPSPPQASRPAPSAEPRRGEASQPPSADTRPERPSATRKVERRPDAAPRPSRDLPGEPANRVYRQRPGPKPQADRQRPSGGSQPGGAQPKSRGERRPKP
ncbi:MAG: hypothetical protein OEM49_06240 [Myxococcales bacterium]|nr:hypothetical protein [Myxococcales bacterium]MDH5306103.1 hypothetical protein [Myxococcales bacterium]MDH5565435.1 hypothetical protein [Myxococcales bacterium]